MPAQVHLRLDISGERQFSRRLHGLLTFVSDWQPFFEKIAANWKDLVAERFKHEGAVDGEPAWPALSARYAAWKQRKFPGQPILQRTGDMLAALTEPSETITSTRLEIEVDSPYAIHHHHGAPRANLPQRVIASLTAALKRRIMADWREAFHDA